MDKPVSLAERIAACVEQLANLIDNHVSDPHARQSIGGVLNVLTALEAEAAALEIAYGQRKARVEALVAERDKAIDSLVQQSGKWDDYRLWHKRAAALAGRKP